MKLTLTDYIKKRNGVAMGSSKSLRNNLYRSFGAKDFTTFWKYWNPIFGYYLGKHIFKPLKRTFPVAFALLFTFIFCGLLHDVITMIVWQKISFFFSVLFLLMGLAVLVTKFFKVDCSQQIWLARAFVNLSIIALCLLLTIFIMDFI